MASWRSNKYDQQMLFLISLALSSFPPSFPPSLPPSASHLVVLGVELLGPVEGVALRAHVVADAVSL